MFSDSQFSSIFSIQLVYIQLIAVAAIKHVLGLLHHSAHPLALTTGVSFLRKQHLKKKKFKKTLTYLFFKGGGGGGDELTTLIFLEIHTFRSLFLHRVLI